MIWTGWTQEAETLLLELRRKGRSFGQCAEEIGCTRNTAIGRAKTLRASEYGSGFGMRPKRTQMRIVGNQATPIAPPARHALPEPSTGTNRALMDLRTGDCRWPVGDFYERTEFFCGDAITSSRYGAPYCAKHHARAYHPASRKQG